MYQLISSVKGPSVDFFQRIAAGTIRRAMIDQSADNSERAVRIALLEKERVGSKISIELYFARLTSVLSPPFKPVKALLQGAIADAFGILNDRIKILLTHDFHSVICYLVRQ